MRHSSLSSPNAGGNVRFPLVASFLSVEIWNLQGFFFFPGQGIFFWGKCFPNFPNQKKKIPDLGGFER